MRLAVALILFSAATPAWGADLTRVEAFCAEMAGADVRSLEQAERQLDAIKQEIVAIAALEAKRATVARDAVVARARHATQRRDTEALREQFSYLSPTMLEERRVVGADLRAHLEVLDRYHQIEALLDIELRRIDAELAGRHAQVDARVRAAVSASEPELRRCIGARRERLR